jgi:sodium-dependent dicarboxylate transporter 2/3/5
VTEWTAAADGAWSSEAQDGHPEAEQRFDRIRHTVGLFLGPAVFLLFWLLPMPALSVEAHRLAAIVGLVVVWWTSEAIPIPATALIGTALAVVTGVATAQDAFGPFASPTIFLFMGSFMIGQAVTEHHLDRRLALSLISLRGVRGNFTRIVVVLGGFTAAVSAWMSNTATTAMMLPIALGILNATAASQRRDSRVTAPFLLSIAYSASVGGIITPVGTPPNLITIGLLDKLSGVRIDFFSWMVLATPIAAILMAATLGLSYWRIGAARKAAGAPSRDAVTFDASPPGPWTRGQRNCAIAFGVAAVLWITPGALALVASPDAPITRLIGARLDEAVVAVVAAGLLFLLPVDWRQRRFTLGWASAARIDWGTILLFGGGLALGRLMFVTGLAAHIGQTVIALSGAQSLWTVTAVAVGLAIALTEVTSNTAATNMLVPVVISICQAAGLSPIAPAVGTALGASMAFLLPISTPPNAIVYGTGLVPITRMIRYGFVLDVTAFVVIVLGLRVLCPMLGYV